LPDKSYRTYRANGDTTKNAKQFGGNYIGGMDIMNAKGWVVSDNVFIGIHGLTGEARGAIFFWNQSFDCVIERNIILDCDTGIYLGNGGMRLHSAAVRRPIGGTAAGFLPEPRPPDLRQRRGLRLIR
jgi:hypothetical protein